MKIINPNIITIDLLKKLWWQPWEDNDVIANEFRQFINKVHLRNKSDFNTPRNIDKTLKILNKLEMLEMYVILSKY